MQGKLKNDEDFGIDGRIQVILLKRNSNDYHNYYIFLYRSACLERCMRCNDMLSVLNPQVDICLHMRLRMIAAILAARRSASARET